MRSRRFHDYVYMPAIDNDSFGAYTRWVNYMAVLPHLGTGGRVVKLCFRGP